MSRYEFQDLDVHGTINQFGAVMPVDYLGNITIQPHGNFAGGWSVQLQGIVGEHADWIDIGAPIAAAATTSAGLVALTHAWKKLRLKSVAIGTGAKPNITVAGQNLRTDG